MLQPLSKGFLFFNLVNCLGPFYQGGSRGTKKRKSNNDDKRGHGLKKRRPPTYVEGNMKRGGLDVNKSVPTFYLAHVLHMLYTLHFQ